MVTLLCRALRPSLFEVRNGVITNYIDDIIMIARCLMIAKLQFECCMEVMRFLNFKLTAKKTAEPAFANVVLGLELNGAESAVKVSKARAATLLKTVNIFLSAPADFETKALETLIGKLGFLAYHCNYGPFYMAPLYALKWMSPSKRGAVMDAHSEDGATPLALRIRAAWVWWVNLLNGKRILWCVNNQPETWSSLCTDSSGAEFGGYDTKGNVSCGTFADLKIGDEIIAFKELFAVNEHFRLFPPERGSGQFLACDNMQVVHTVN